MLNEFKIQHFVLAVGHSENGELVVWADPDSSHARIQSDFQKSSNDFDLLTSVHEESRNEKDR